MEQEKILTEKILIGKINILEKAVLGYEQTLALDSSQYKVQVADAINNGKIQKFEYCSELLWKTVKRYLLVQHNIDSKSPKQTVKEFYLIGKLSENEYNVFLDILDTRNRLSHIYKEEFFKEILEELPGFLKLMKSVVSTIKTKE